MAATTTTENVREGEKKGLPFPVLVAARKRL